MPEHATPFWSADERRLIDSILDQIIPASADGRVPAAGSLGVADFVAERVSEDAGYQAVVSDGLALAAGLDGINTATLERLEITAPEFFAVLLPLVYKGYYSRPDTRPLFGLSAKPVHPDGYDVPGEPAELINALTAPVRTRGNCFRDTPDGRR